MKKLWILIILVLLTLLILSFLYFFSLRPDYTPEGHSLSDGTTCAKEECIRTLEKDVNGCTMVLRGNEVLSDMDDCGDP